MHNGRRSEKTTGEDCGGDPAAFDGGGAKGEFGPSWDADGVCGAWRLHVWHSSKAQSKKFEMGQSGSGGFIGRPRLHVAVFVPPFVWF